MTGDWERGYDTGYERALSHVVLMASTYPLPAVTMVADIVAKLSKEVLHDEQVKQDAQR